MPYGDQVSLVKLKDFQQRYTIPQFSRYTEDSI